MLLNISEYLKSLPQVPGETFIPAKQLLIQIIDLMTKFKKSKMIDIGFFHYIKNYFNKKYSQSFERTIRSFLKSLVKFGKEGSQVGWFAKLVETNTEYLIVSALVRAVSMMRKKYQDLNSKYDDTFKRVKMNIQDILKMLKRIYCPQIKGYTELNGINLQTRVRDYVIEIQPSVIMETSGLGFLEIVRREAYLVKSCIERDLTESTKTDDLFRYPENEGSKDIKKMQENFYTINDLMGIQQHHLPKGYVKNVKKYQMYQRMGDVRVDPKLREGGENYEPEGAGAVEDIEELTFDDIYESIYDKQNDRDFLDLIKNLQKMEGKSQALDKDLEEIPSFAKYIDELKKKIIKLIAERSEKLNFMKQLITKIQNHEQSKGELESMLDPELLEEAEAMNHFYNNYGADLNAMLFGVVKIERHSMTDYFASSNASKFKRHDPYDYNKKRVQIDIDDDEDQDDEEDPDREYRRKAFRKRKTLIDTLGEFDADEEVDDDSQYQRDLQDAVRNTTITAHKQRLKNRRIRNQENSRARMRMIENMGGQYDSYDTRSIERRSRSRSSMDSEARNVQQNLGRLAEYVKSAEYKKRKDLENNSVSSDEGEIVFKNTKGNDDETEGFDENAPRESDIDEQDDGYVKYEKIQRSPVTPSEDLDAEDYEDDDDDYEDEEEEEEEEEEAEEEEPSRFTRKRKSQERQQRSSQKRSQGKSPMHTS